MKKFFIVLAALAVSIESLYAARAGGRMGQGRYGGTAGNISSRQTGMQTGVNRGFSGSSSLRQGQFRQGQGLNAGFRTSALQGRQGQTGFNRQLNRQFNVPSNIANRGFNRPGQQMRALTGAQNLSRRQISQRQMGQRNINQRLNPMRLNPNRRNDPNYARNFGLQRNFLNRNFRNHSWNWWWRNNPRFFYGYFPTVFYSTYGYYPPIYYDYYDEYQTYPSTVSTSEVYGPEYNLVTYDNTSNLNQAQQPQAGLQVEPQVCFDNCKGQCLNQGGGDYACSQQCQQRCA